jgi:hypothetical protein
VALEPVPVGHMVLECKAQGQGCRSDWCPVSCQSRCLAGSSVWGRFRQALAEAPRFAPKRDPPLRILLERSRPQTYAYSSPPTNLSPDRVQTSKLTASELQVRLDGRTHDAVGCYRQALRCKPENCNTRSKGRMAQACQLAPLDRTLGS